MVAELRLHIPHEILHKYLQILVYLILGWRNMHLYLISEFLISVKFYRAATYSTQAIAVRLHNLIVELT